MKLFDGSNFYIKCEPSLNLNIDFTKKMKRKRDEAKLQIQILVHEQIQFMSLSESTRFTALPLHTGCIAMQFSLTTFMKHKKHYKI